jgi:hypothetical protein
LHSQTLLTEISQTQSVDKKHIIPAHAQSEIAGRLAWRGKLGEQILANPDAFRIESRH